MSVWHMQPDLAASRRQHKQLYQVQGRYLLYVGLVALACLLYYVWFFLQFGISGEQLTTGLQQMAATWRGCSSGTTSGTGRSAITLRKSASPWPRLRRDADCHGAGAAALLLRRPQHHARRGAGDPRPADAPPVLMCCADRHGYLGVDFCTRGRPRAAGRGAGDHHAGHRSAGTAVRGRTRSRGPISRARADRRGREWPAKASLWHFYPVVPDLPRA